jgi:hypothetical protein
MIEQIRSFSELQRALVCKIKTQHNIGPDDRFLIGLIPSGSLSHGGHTWQFVKHGAGVQFTRAEDGTVIDAHQHFHSPEVVDEWRMSLFLESIGVPTGDLTGEINDLLQQGTLSPYTPDKTCFIVTQEESSD